MKEKKTREKPSWATIIISLFAVGLSCYATYIASQARKDARAVAHLDFRPLLRITTQLQESKGAPPHLTIWNMGPVDAIQLEVQLFALIFSPGRQKIRTIVTGSTEEKRIEKLSTWNRVSVSLPDHWLNVQARTAKPMENNVMEIRLIYRREADLRQFVERAFYFVNPEGQWVSENDGSLSKEVYSPIIKAANQTPAVGLLWPLFDPLHPAEDVMDNF